MQSRMEKYYQPKKTEAKRSDRNAKLYQEIYKNYDSLENLPLSNNINEIDATSLKKMVLEKEEVKEEKNLKYKEEVTENSFSRREKLDENKIHDINKLLEHAKKENSKLKDDTITRKSYNFLSTLESKELTKEEVMKAKEAYEKKSDIPDNEVKYQTKKISVDPSIEQVLTNTASLSLDILSDLKPNDDNSGVVEAKIEDEDNLFKKKNNSSNDDVNIIKDNNISVVDDEVDEESSDNFYTDMYNFSNKDFEDEEFIETGKSHTWLKVLLLIVGIIICVLIIFYFITYFGLGA